MSVVVVGLNHRTVSLDLLERMAVPASRMPKALADLAGREHLSEVVVLSTCHRTEVYGVAEGFHGAVQDVRHFLSELAAAPPEDFCDHLYTYYDEAAVGHLFGVSAGLDSVVLGEGEILGQVKDAWDAARGQGTAGPRLSALFRHAVEVGKRARSQTGIARGVTSLSQAAVAMAVERLGSLAGRTAVLLGVGEMGESMAVALAGAGIGEVRVVNRTEARAAELAARIGGKAVRMARLGSALAEADVLLASTAAPSLVVDHDDLAQAMDARGGRPLLVVDVAMPRDVDPSVASLPGVTLLDLDDLRSFTAAGMAERRKEISAVQAIIVEEVDRYADVAAARRMAPTVAALHDRAEGVRARELQRFSARLSGLDDRQREAVEALTRRIVGKLLHEPTASLKDAAGTPRGARLADALRELFGL